MKKITILCATKGNNLKLAHKLSKHIDKQGMSFELVDLEAMDLPLYTPSREEVGVPDQAISLRDLMNESSGLILVAPEYNGSMPPIINNAIAWLSRSGGDNWRGSFNNKIAIVATHSGGGGQKVAGAMRQQLEHLGAIVLPRPIITNYQKELDPDSADTIISQMRNLIS